jgi:CHAT domain-containing protein/tetratricopeptide (TPR) repeat protein
MFSPYSPAGRLKYDLSSVPIGCLLALTSMLLALEDPDAILRKAQSDLSAGRYRAAIRGGEQAAGLFRQTRDDAKTARALTNVGLAQMYSGDYEPALQNFNEASSLSQKAKDFDHHVTSLNNIGTVFYFRGLYSDAMNLYREALDNVAAIPNEKARASRRQLTTANIAILYQTLGQYDRALTLYNELLNSPQALSAPEQAQVLANAGVLRRRLGDPEKAMSTYHAAQALYKKAGLLDGEIAVLNNIGIVQAMDLSDFHAAAATFTDSLELAVKSGNRPLSVQARLYRGQTYLRGGELIKSSADFTAAANDAKLLGEQEEEWKAEYGLASVAVRRGHPAAAIDLLRHAVGLIESMRSALGSHSLRSAFLADKRSVYDLLIEKSTNIEEVFGNMEHSRARGLSDRITQPRPTSLSALTSSLPAGTAVLEYWIGESSAAVIWMSARQSGIRRWAFTAAGRDTISSVHSLLSDPKSTDWATFTAPLARQLFAGVAPLNDPLIQRLIIVPDGPLGQIPFEALPFGKGLLIDRFTVSYSPAASLTADAPKRRAVRWFWQPSIEAFADPAPGTGEQSDLLNVDRWTRLPYAGPEVHSIAGVLGGRAFLHEGPDALKSALRQSTQAPVLHFATHAFADIENPDLSYILLAPGTRSQRFDYLFQKEVGELPLTGVQLLTLSACETALGKFVPGEGSESFSRAFLAAGVPTVVTSLWSVSDKSTAGLMVRFYARLAAGDSVAEALRSAKLEFLHSATASHPAYWAAFVVNGDGAMRLPYIIGWKWFVIPVVLAGLALFVKASSSKRRQKRRNGAGVFVAIQPKHLDQ